MDGRAGGSHMRKLVNARIQRRSGEAIDERRDWWRVLCYFGGIPHHLTVGVGESSWGL